MQIQENSVVMMHYTLRDGDGATIDSSVGHDPLTYIQGMGQIVPGLEKAMDGRSKGDKFSVVVAAVEGYGEFDEELIQQVPRSAFKDMPTLEVGMQFYAQGPEGHPIVVSVTGIEGDTITVDGNHELAGKDLNFEIEIADIRTATAEELEHGHVHGPGGHQH